jgi:hypothetical protein
MVAPSHGVVKRLEHVAGIVAEEVTDTVTIDGADLRRKVIVRVAAATVGERRTEIVRHTALRRHDHLAGMDIRDHVVRDFPRTGIEGQEREERQERRENATRTASRASRASRSGPARHSVRAYAGCCGRTANCAASARKQTAEATENAATSGLTSATKHR